MIKVYKIKLLIIILLFSVSYLIINCNGVGTDESTDSNGITDTADETPPTVAQTIPPNLSTDIDPATIISLFFDDVISSASITNSSVQVTVQSNGSSISGQLFTTSSQAGNTIVTFVPNQSLPENEVIIVTLPTDNGITDDGGNKLETPFEMSFSTTTKSPALSSSNLGFETGDTGISFDGDGARLNGVQGAISPVEGSWMAAISSGEDFLGGGVVSSTEALLNTTSVLTTGEITVPGGNTNLIFDYDLYQLSSTNG